MIGYLVWLVLLIAVPPTGPPPLPDALPPLVADPCVPAFMCGYHVR